MGRGVKIKITSQERLVGAARKSKNTHRGTLNVVDSFGILKKTVNQREV